MPDKPSPIDAAAHVSHRHLLGALAVLLLLGIAALLGFASPSMAEKGRALWMAMPIVIVTAVAALYGMGKRVDKRSMDAVRNDELRQASLQRAWRNG